MGNRAAKRKVNYEANMPRCRICVHFQRSKTTMRDSLPAIVAPSYCKLHKFIVDVYGVCDTWEDHKGATLEAA